MAKSPNNPKNTNPTENVDAVETNATAPVVEDVVIEEPIVEKTQDNQTVNLTTDAPVESTVATPFMALANKQSLQSMNVDTRLTEQSLRDDIREVLDLEISKSLALTNLIKRLVDYVNNMGPSNVTSVETGVKYQHVLFDAFVGILEAKSDEALAGLQIMQYVFTKYKLTAMRREYVFRFMNLLRMNNPRNVMLQSLLHLFTTIAEMEKPNSAVLIQQIDIARLANGLLTDTARVNLLNYVDTLN